MIMYKTKSLISFFLVLFLGVLTACSETEVVNDPSVIDTKPIIFESTPVEKHDISFYAGGDWTASLSNTAWIQLDQATKVGPKGEARVSLSCRANEGTKERTSVLTVKVENEEAYEIKITQVPHGSYVIIEAKEVVFAIDPALNNNRGAFTAGLNVLSNSKWSIKSLPEWVSYMAEDDKEPVEGVQTSVNLIFQADPASFDAAQMNGLVEIENLSNPGEVFSIPMIVTSDFVTKNSLGEEISTFMMSRSAAAGNNYMVSMTVESNTAWSINMENLPEWLSIPVFSNEKEYALSLETTKSINLFFEESLIDTDKLETEITLENPLLGLTKKVKIVFPGTGLDYFECTLRIPNEFEFSASRWDENGEIPGAVKHLDFSMLSGTDYTSDLDAPFQFFFIKGQNGFTMKEEIYWAQITYEGKSEQATYGPLHKHDFVLFVHDNFAERREGYLVIADKGVTFEDLFIDGTEDLKPEYDNAKTHFAQQGAPSGDFDCAIEDNYVAFTKEGDTQLFEIFTSPEMVSADFGFSEWLSINFVYDEGKFLLEVKAKPNTTGEVRYQEVHIMQYVPEDDSEKSIYSFLVEQAGK